MVTNLVIKEVLLSIPSGKSMIFVITDIIIPIDTYSIHLKKNEFTLILLDNITPNPLHK